MNTLLCLFFLSLVLVSAQLGIRDRCGLKNDKICVLVDGCPEAMDLIKKREHDKLEVCGWQNKTQIVCCNLDEFKNPTTERKAVEECIKYGNDVDITPFIINGLNATLGDYPHMAALGFESNNASSPYAFDCAGTLISDRYVLTAAHCLATRGVLVMIRLGKIDLFGDADNTEAQDIPVRKEDFIPHPKYDHFKRRNDIALIRLSTPAKFTKYVRPACLYLENDNPTGLYISGWGVTERGSRTISRFLQHAPVAHVDLNRCNDTIFNSPSNTVILESQLCAIGEGEKVTDTCQGDSGGPIQTTNRKNYGTPFMIVGVTSFGAGCASKSPGIYTRVASYVDWIEEIVWPN